MQTGIWPRENTSVAKVDRRSVGTRVVPIRFLISQVNIRDPKALIFAQALGHVAARLKLLGCKANGYPQLHGAKSASAVLFISIWSPDYC